MEWIERLNDAISYIEEHLTYYSKKSPTSKVGNELRPSRDIDTQDKIRYHKFSRKKERRKKR